MNRRNALKLLGGSVLAMGCGPGARNAPALNNAATPGAPKPRKSLLLLGGTTFLGPAIMDSALARGHSVTMFNRGHADPQLYPQVERLQGDRDGDLRALEGRKWDAVIDTSGYVPRQVAATARLLAPNVGSYVFVSTVSVYGDDCPAGTDERSPVQTVPADKLDAVQNSNEKPWARKEYGALKAMSETAAEKAMPGRVLVVRPTVLVGPGDPTGRFTYWAVRVARGGNVLAPGTGRDPVQFVDVRDLADFMVTSIEANRAGTYNVTGPARPPTMRELLEGCLPAEVKGATFTWVERSFLEARGVRPFEEMPLWTGGTEGSAIVGTRALEHGLVLRPLKASARDTLAWFDTQDAKRRASWFQAGLDPERERTILAEWAARSRLP